MKKTIIAAIAVFTALAVLGCSDPKPPMTYNELLSYKGSNESLYRYLLMTAVEDRPLFDKWMVDMGDKDNLLKYFANKLSNKGKRAWMLNIFFIYYNELEKLLNLNIKNKILLKESYCYTINFWKNSFMDYINELDLNINNDMIDELTDIFLSFPFD